MKTKQQLAISFACRQSKASKKTGEAPIECFISVNGKRARIALPKKVKPELFRPLLNAPEPNDVSIYCTAVKSKINDIQTALYVQGEVITSARIADVYQNGSIKQSYTLKDMWNGFKDLKMKEDIEPHTWNKYNNVFNAFLKATKHKETDEVSSVKNADILVYEAEIRKNRADTTCCKDLKNLKAFFAYAVACGKIQINPFGAKKIGHGSTNKSVAYLTYEEIQKLKLVKLNSERLSNVLIVFLWQCFTGMNYSDMKILQEGDVKFANRQYYIEKPRYKTGRFGKEHYYKAVLIEDAVTIYENYGEKLPLISQAKYNKYLKEIMNMAGIDKNITSKSGRKTYACILTNHLGIDDYNVLKQMLGHENIKQTQEYCEIFKETVLTEIREKTKEKIRKEIEEKYPNDPERQKLERIFREVDD